MHRRPRKTSLQELLANVRYRSKWRTATSLLSVLVILGTISAVMLPAITLTDDSCPLAEHQHTELCYMPAEQASLVCSETALNVHGHTAECYDAHNQLTCALADFMVHTHDERCFAGSDLLCPLPEILAHQHGQACYAAAEPADTESHSHDDTCYPWTQADAPSCNTAESEAHQHNESCFEQVQGELICPKPETEPTQQAPAPELICTAEEITLHTHSEACHSAPAADASAALICGQLEVREHLHTDSCFRREQVLVCQLEAHTHSDACGMDPVAEPAETAPTGETAPTETVSPTEQSVQYGDIFVEGQMTPAPEGAELQVQPLEAGSTDYRAALQKASAYLDEGIADAYVMEIHPVDAAGSEIPTTGGEYTVTLEFSAPILAGEGQIHLLHILDSGEVESLPVILERSGDAVSGLRFTTDSFSEFVVAASPVPDTVIDSGELVNQEGTGTLYWELTESDNGNKTLTISGQGGIPLYTNSNQAPWFAYRGTAVKLIFDEGITHTGRYTFQNFVLTDTVFPSTLHTIGTYTFAYARMNSSLEIPGTVKTLEQSAFVHNNSVVEFILNEGLESIGIDALGSQASGSAPLTIPASVTTIKRNPCWTASAYYVAEGSQHFTSIDGVLYSKDGKTLMAYPRKRIAESYTVPEGIIVNETALKSTSSGTQELIISKDVQLTGGQILRDSGYQRVYIQDGVFTKMSDDKKTFSTGELFYGCTNLTEVSLPTDYPYEIGSNIIYNCTQLHSFTIPKNVTAVNARFLDGTQSALTDIYYNAVNANIKDSAVSNSALEFNLHIGKDVDYLPASFAQFVNNAGNIYFDGPNTFYVEKGAFANAPAPIKDLSGWVHISDEDGCLYLLDPDTKTASLYAASPSAEEVFPVLESITPDEVGNENVSFQEFTVTSIHENALYMSPHVIEVQFENAANITNVGAYAFANTNVERMTDVSAGKMATTTQAADTLFSESCVLGYGRYDNTKLAGASSFGPGFAENMNGVQSLQATVKDPIQEGSTLASMNITLQEGSTTQWVVPKQEDLNHGGYESLTGDQLAFQISTSYSAREDARVVYRLYIRRTNASCILGYNVGEYTIKVDKGEIHIKCSATEDPNTFQLDITGTEGVTATVPISVYYPSPRSHGGGVQISGEIVVTTDAGTITYPAKAPGKPTGSTLQGSVGDYVQATWKTQRLEFGLYNENSNAGSATEQKTVSVLADETGVRFHDSLKYTISLNNTGGSGSNLGSDYVNYVDFTSILHLPKGVYWDEAVRNSILHVDNEFLNIAGGAISHQGDPIITISAPSKPLNLMNVGIRINENNEVELSWRIKNNGTGEMSNTSFSLFVHRPALVVEVGPNGLDSSTQPQIAHELSAQIHYTHSDMDSKTDTALKTVQGGEAKLELSKESTAVSYFGEDITYTLHGKNTGGLAMVFEDAGKAYLWDELSVDTYIKPENMRRMFAEAAAAGRMLTIRIDRAQVTDTDRGGYASPVDGIDMQDSKAIAQNVLLNSGNSDLQTREASLLITYDDATGIYTVAEIVETAPGSQGIIPTEEPIRTVSGYDPEALLHRFGYGVTVLDRYTCAWQLRKSGENLEFLPGVDRVVHIYATVKNTYQLSSKDWPNHYPVDSAKSIKNNKAFISLVNDEGKFEDLVQSNAVSNAVRREAIINMNLSYTKDGEVVDCSEAMPDDITHGQVLDYTLRYTHYGSGSYDDLPMVDEISGNQYLLVPKDKNPQLAGLGFDELESDGAYYYRLTPGSYEDIAVGECDGETYIANSIQVMDNNGSISTKIKWYYEHLDGGDYVIDVHFKTVLWLSTDQVQYTIGNQVWMNDRTNDRITASLWGGGILLTYDKQIVTKQGSNPNSDVLFESYTGNTVNPYPVSQGEKVIYRLTLDSTGKGSGTYHGSLFADALPDTYGRFAWTPENVRILDVQVPQGSVGGSEDLTTKWSIQRDFHGIQGDGLYFIRWDDADEDTVQDDDDVYLTFEDNSIVHIYVELTFPVNTDTAQTWREYTSAASGSILSNAFYLDLYNATVTHVLRTPGEVRLQKGVYALARGNSLAANDRFLNFTGSSRHYYNNTDSTLRRAVYYVTLYNGGASRLYINDIQDQLPKGFTFSGLINPENQTSFDKESLMNVTCADGTSDFTMNTQGIEFMSFRVRALVHESSPAGKQNVTFQIDAAGRSHSLAYDENREQYYLENGQAIAFAYAVDIPASGTEDQALNTVAMAYTDHVDAGVVVCDSGRVTANFLDTYIDQNNGDCHILTREEIEQKGYHFTLDNGDPDTGKHWLVSDVLLQRGSIKPGIHKAAVSYRHPSSTDDLPYESSIGYKDTVNWRLRMDNGGDSAIVNYTVTDKMAPPYLFTGPVSYTIYDVHGVPIQKEALTLFTVEGFEAAADANVTNNILPISTPDALKDLITHIKVRDGKDSVKSIAIGADPVELYDSASHPFRLSFRWENSSLVMVVQFHDVYMAIPEQGYMFLDLSTYNCTNYYASMTFTNQAALYPSESQPFRLYDIQSGSKPVYDDKDNLVAVMHSADVTVADASVTNSKKAVTEKNNPSNTTDSHSDNNSIVISGRSSVFTYALTVMNQDGTGTNGAETNPAMKKLVILDNLPMPGDTKTQNTGVERGSQFTVGLADPYKLTVTLISADGKETLMDPNAYTVQFSAKTTFSDADHNGTTDDQWYTYENWLQAGHTLQDVNSIRVILKGTDEAPVVPGGASVSVSFDVVTNRGDEIIPGSYAWNNFGYSYIFAGDEHPNKAMSSDVGVRLAARPWLVKSLTDGIGNAYPAEEDMTFRFLVYPGEKVSSPWDTEAELIALLTQDNRPYLPVELTVPKGASVSTENRLTPIDENGDYMWRWTAGDTYQIVELPYSHEDFDHADWLLNGTPSRNRDRTHSFTYTKEQLMILTCENQYKYWQLEVKKTAADTGELLPGAEFGLYTHVVPENTDGVKTIEIEMDGILTQWYLLDTLTTDDTGLIRFTDLTEDTYYLVEHKAPDGYRQLAEPIAIHRDTNRMVTAYTVTNHTSVRLPETGGTGTFPYIFSGWAMMAIASTLIYQTHRKKRKEDETV